jgi:hypothetical protein
LSQQATCTWYEQIAPISCLSLTSQVYGKAIRSLQQEKEDYEDVDSLSTVSVLIR